MKFLRLAPEKNFSRKGAKTQKKEKKSIDEILLVLSLRLCAFA
jgi:hypothetical protein